MLFIYPFTVTFKDKARNEDFLAVLFRSLIQTLNVCVCGVCLCVCVRVCVRACVRACVCVGPYAAQVSITL
jgi:hypothetical protein